MKAQLAKNNEEMSRVRKQMQEMQVASRNPRENGLFQKRETGICHYCNKVGHIQRDCRKKNADGSQQSRNAFPPNPYVQGTPPGRFDSTRTFPRVQGPLPQPALGPPPRMQLFVGQDPIDNTEGWSAPQLASTAVAPSRVANPEWYSPAGNPLN